ncbi:MAG: prepilin-type N-terminal cleavage/methylation domain-containing protein [Pseudomonadota bacterium]
MAHRRASAAFTLVEIAVVLSIIGLLVGAVIGGVKLVRQSEIQTIIGDSTKYYNAFVQFKQQYGGYPGDIVDARDFFGTTANGVTVNNGDNNNTVTGAEAYQAWLQLVLAKLVNGNFTGAASGGGAVPGTNVPKGRINTSGWSFENNTASAGNSIWYAQDLGNMLSFGGTVPAATTQGPVITTLEAAQVDAKMDDGLPATGRVVALKPTTSVIPNCTSSATDASALYAKSTQGNVCSLNISLTTK